MIRNQVGQSRPHSRRDLEGGAPVATRDLDGQLREKGAGRCEGRASMRITRALNQRAVTPRKQRSRDEEDCVLRPQRHHDLLGCGG